MARGYLLVPESLGDISGMFSGMFRVPGALVRFQPSDTERMQLFYTNEYARAATWAIQSNLPILTRRRKKDLEWKYLAHTVLVRRRDSAANTNNPWWKVLAECDATDYLRVVTSGGQNVWRHYRAAGTEGRWRPDAGELLRDVTERYQWAGDTLLPNTLAGGTGSHDDDTGEFDRTVDD